MSWGEVLLHEWPTAIFLCPHFKVYTSCWSFENIHLIWGAYKICANAMSLPRMLWEIWYKAHRCHLHWKCLIHLSVSMVSLLQPTPLDIAISKFLSRITKGKLFAHARSVRPTQPRPSTSGKICLHVHVLLCVKDSSDIYSSSLPTVSPQL